MLSIVEELRTNRESGARRLEAEYKAGLMTLARRLCDDEGDAEELVNSTFADVIEGIDDYLEQSAFFGWMCKILENRFAKEKRRKSNRTVVAVGEAVDGAVDESGADRIVQGVDAALLRDAIDGLPDEMKEALMLRYFMGLPVARVAKLLSVPEGTAKWRLHCARMILAAKLGVAAQKPGVKALLIALALAALTAIGAAVVAAVGGGETDHSTAIDGSQEFSTAIGSRLQSAADDGYRDLSAAGSRLQSAADTSTPPLTHSSTPPLSPTTSGDTMNATTATRTAAMLAAATLATGAPFTANAGDYIWNVAEGQTETIDASGVAAIGADNLVKTGRGKLVSSADMAAYTGTITVREGAFEIKTTSDLGTADGGTFVEDGGTLVVNMASKDQQFGSEIFTIAGAGDAAYGAAIYQSNRGNDQNKLLHHVVLSDDATIRSGTHLGLVSGELTMNGHTLTITGAGTFTFRYAQTPAPVGNFVLEAKEFRFRGGANYTGDTSKTLTVRNGSTLTMGTSDDVAPPVWWNLVVEEGGKVVAEPSRNRAYYGDVVWNSTAMDGASGPLTFNGQVTGTGTIKASSGTLTFAKPLGAGVGLGLSGTATALLPPPNAYSYENAGLMVGRYGKGDAWWEFNNNRVSEWKLCLEGPGPQIDQLYWTKGWWGDATGTEGEESIGGNWSLGAKGYMWNRESTNVTFHVWCRVLYKTYVAIGGSTCFVARNNNIDTDNEVTISANSCVSFLAVTAGSGSGTPGLYNSTTGLKISGGNVLRDSGNGWLFTTSPVSGLENPPMLPNLALAGDGTLDMNNMPLSVAALSGAGQVENVTTFSVSNSWTLAAADIMADATLEVDGDLAFGNGCAFSVTNLRSLPTSEIYTVCTADSITGFTSGTDVVDRGRKWRFTLSSDGKAITLQNVPQSTVLYVR